VHAAPGGARVDVNTYDRSAHLNRISDCCWCYLVPLLLLLQAHLQERFGSVFIDSSGGDVSIAIAPGTEGTLQLQGRGGIAVDPALKVGEGTLREIFYWS
jgi:hypothetical protein